MENQQIGIIPPMAYDKQLATQLYYPAARAQPRTLTIEELDGGFVVNTYGTDGHNGRFVAHNARVLGRKLKAWADPTPATPPVTPATPDA